MSAQEILLNGGSILTILLTLVQVSPIKLNPWPSFKKLLRFLCRALGKILNADVIERLDRMEKVQSETKQRLDEHVRVDDERNADLHCARILQFNTELLKDGKHTEEDFNEILYSIDCYESLFKIY